MAMTQKAGKAGKPADTGIKNVVLIAHTSYTLATGEKFDKGVVYPVDQSKYTKLMQERTDGGLAIFGDYVPKKKARQVVEEEGDDDQDDQEASESAQGVVGLVDEAGEAAGVVQV